MLAYIKGTLVEAQPLRAVIEVNGLGYELQIPVTTAERLPTTGKEVKLFTHVVYREDSQTIYGFISTEDRSIFQLLIEKVNGVGPKMALSLLSKLAPAALQGAVAAGDINLLSKVPGIGKKTAERLIVELKDKIGVITSIVPTVSSIGGVEGAPAGQASVYYDALSAMVSLGYKPAEAEKSVRKVIAQLGDAATVESVIKKALSG